MDDKPFGGKEEAMEREGREGRGRGIWSEERKGRDVQTLIDGWCMGAWVSGCETGPALTRIHPR